MADPTGETLEAGVAALEQDALRLDAPAVHRRRGAVVERPRPAHLGLLGAVDPNGVVGGRAPEGAAPLEVTGVGVGAGVD